MAGTARLSYDRTLCAASASCVQIEPEVFDQDDDGLAMVLDHEPATELLDKVRLAVRLCPVHALRLDETD